MTNAVVHAEIDEGLKEEAAVVLATIGLTASDAVRLMMIRIVQDKALPFESLVPNSDTIEAMKASRQGHVMGADSAEELLAKLNADD